jgi:hypothetical protein
MAMGYFTAGGLGPGREVTHWVGYFVGHFGAVQGGLLCPIYHHKVVAQNLDPMTSPMHLPSDWLADDKPCLLKWAARLASYNALLLGMLLFKRFPAQLLRRCSTGADWVAVERTVPKRSLVCTTFT